MAKGLVCVTGASGFVGSAVVAELLDAGYTVRGTVRDASNTAKVGFLEGLPGADERLELVEADLLVEGSFDTAVAGCSAVFHVASPYFLHSDDPQRDLVDPALNGTLNVLNACAKADTVRRVVLTSSVTAITDEPVEGKVFTEADWNEKSSLDRNPYYYSKTLAERAAWNFMDEQEPGFDLVVVNPSAVIGPSLCPSLNTSNEMISGLVGGSLPAIYNASFAMVDVRDVALAHRLALENPEANGRYLCMAQIWQMEELADFLGREGYGEKLPRLNLASSWGDRVMKLMAYTQPKGMRTFVQTQVGRRMQMDNSKIKAELGLEFRPVEESILDTVQDLPLWGHV